MREYNTGEGGRPKQPEAKAMSMLRDQVNKLKHQRDVEAAENKDLTQ